MKGIVAMDLNRVIGNNGKVPWRLPEDLKFFKKMTSDPDFGGYLLMGRTTFDSVGALPDRHTYVLTNDPEKLRQKETPGYRYLTEDTFWRISHPDKRIWVCGGAKVYKRFLPLCTEVYVTIVLDEYDGDTYLPPFEDNFSRQTKILECKTHWIIKYSKYYDISN